MSRDIPIIFSAPMVLAREHSGRSASAAFEMLWLHLHGADSWDENPEVVALTFKVHATNIDSLKVAA